MAGPEAGARATVKAVNVGKKQRYLRTEIGALDAQLDTCGALKFGVLAASFCLTLPSSLGARHAFVCGRGCCRPVTSRGACAQRARHIAQLGPMSGKFPSPDL